MKKNFSKKLQTILKYAKEDAIRLGQSYVGSEHLLIGLIKIKSGISSKIFELYDLDIKSVITFTTREVNLASLLATNNTNQTQIIIVISNIDMNHHCQKTMMIKKEVLDVEQLKKSEDTMDPRLCSTIRTNPPPSSEPKAKAAPKAAPLRPRRLRSDAFL